MRTDLATRPFPFTCHAVWPAKPRTAFFMFCVGLAFLLMYLVAASQPMNQMLDNAFYLTSAGFWLSGMAIIPIRMGFRDVLPSRVVVFRGATWVLPKVGSVEQLLIMFGGATVAASGILYGMVVSWPSLSDRDGSTLTGPIIFVGGSYLFLFSLWQLFRGIRMTPESMTYWRGKGRITLAWEELGDAIPTNNVRDHDPRRWYADRDLPGAKIVIPVERASDVRLPVHWEDEHTPRLLLETNHFMVEPSALLTAILALRDNQQLRPLLGTRDSKVLFKGPPWWVRRRMDRNQQWWPAGEAPYGIAVNRHGLVKDSQ